MNIYKHNRGIREAVFIKLKKFKRIALFAFVAIPLLLLGRYLIFSPHELYVSPSGKNSNPGTKYKPFQTIQKAIDSADPDTSIIISSGTYRESVTISKKGKRDARLKLTAVEKGNVILSGADLTSIHDWKKCDESCEDINPELFNNIYFFKLQNGRIPTMVIEKSKKGEENLLFLARTPNFEIPDDGRFHQNWATAGDSDNPDTEIKDKNLLISDDDFTGAVAYIMDGDSRCGGALYKKKVASHNNKNGSIGFEEDVGYEIYGSKESGISDKTKYFLENKIEFLDSPGEWYFDQNEKILYVWPYNQLGKNNSNLEITYKPYGILINGSSFITIDGLSFKHYGANPDSPDISGAIVLKALPSQNVDNIQINNIAVSDTVFGIQLLAFEPEAKITDIRITNNQLHHIQKDSITVIGSAENAGNISGVSIQGSEIHHNSYLENDIGVNIILASKVNISNNYIHDTANYGIHITGPEKSKAIVKDITVSQNRIENTCQNISGCSALKFFGGKFENTVASSNILANNDGWSYCQEASGNSTKGFAHGLFISNASGIKAEKNIAVNNNGASFTVYPRQIEASNNSFIGNLAAYSDTGIDLSSANDANDYSPEVKRTRHIGTVIKNNILVNNRNGLYLDVADPKSVEIDYNAYIDNDENSVKTNSNVDWDKNSIKSNITAFKNALNGNYNISYLSSLRTSGEPFFKQKILQMQLDILGLWSNLGPCPFNWMNNTCPIVARNNL